MLLFMQFPDIAESKIVSYVLGFKLVLYHIAIMFLCEEVMDLIAFPLLK